jgi:phosphoribosylformylglycinamidine cyclo-ligase
MQERGRVPQAEMYQVFNMGIGMAVIVAPDDAAKFSRTLKAKPIGVIARGTGKTCLHF